MYGCGLWVCNVGLWVVGVQGCPFYTPNVVTGHLIETHGKGLLSIVGSPEAFIFGEAEPDTGISEPV